MKATVVSFLLASLVWGCKDNTVTVYTDALGTYRGKVAQYGVDGNLVPNQAGATFRIEGTAFSTVTDDSGNFQIDHVPAGIYNLLVTKPGFDTNLAAQYHFSGAGTVFLQNLMIQTIPFDSILILNAVFQRQDTVYDTTEAYSYHIKIFCKNIGSDSLVPVSVTGVDLRSKYVFDIPHSDQTSRTFEADTTLHSVWWWPPGSMHLVDSGDSIVITTRAWSFAPNSKYPGRNAPFSVSRTFILP